jgi:hypothetical protein
VVDVPTEIMLAVLGVLGTLIGAWGYSMRKAADARLAAMTMQMEDAEARRTHMEAESAQAKALMEMFQQQIEINRQNAEQAKSWVDALREKETKDESNYKTLRLLQDDNTRYLAQAIKDSARESRKANEDAARQLAGLIGDMSRRIVDAVETLPPRMEANTQEQMKGFAAEIGMVLAQQIALYQLSQELSPFPDASDPGWEGQTIRPLLPGLRLRRRPIYDDRALVAGDGALIQGEGEAVRMIRGRLKDWLIVMKGASGSAPTWGWVPEQAVQIVGAGG